MARQANQVFIWTSGWPTGDQPGRLDLSPHATPTCQDRGSPPEWGSPTARPRWTAAQNRNVISSTSSPWWYKLPGAPRYHTPCAISMAYLNWVLIKIKCRGGGESRWLSLTLTLHKLYILISIIIASSSICVDFINVTIGDVPFISGLYILFSAANRNTSVWLDDSLSGCSQWSEDRVNMVKVSPPPHPHTHTITPGDEWTYCHALWLSPAAARYIMNEIRPKTNTAPTKSLSSYRPKPQIPTLHCCFTGDFWRLDFEWESCLHLVFNILKFWPSRKTTNLSSSF